MSGNTENLIKRNLTQDYPTNYNIPGSNQHMEYNTLREGNREFMRIFNKTQYVVIPRFSANQNKDLRNWDLWGPLVFTMFFMSDSKDEEEMSKTFCLVFIFMWLGGSIITLNSILLGAKITLCQSLCVLGYCLFPEMLASILLNYLPKIILNVPVRMGIAGGAFIWSSTSSISFMGDIVGQEKKSLAVFPIYLFYFAFCCYLLL